VATSFGKYCAIFFNLICPRGPISLTGDLVSAPSILQVFINPAVSALPEHAHLFAESGCFVSRGQPNKQCGDLKDAGKESKLPDSFLPIRLTPEMDTAWENHVFGKTSR
jgi:hypothetical protein